MKIIILIEKASLNYLDIVINDSEQFLKNVTQRSLFTKKLLLKNVCVCVLTFHT